MSNFSQMMAKNYRLQCLHPQCGRIYDDDEPAPRMRCEGELSGDHGPALLRPIYQARKMSVRSRLPGIFPYLDWLPVEGYYLEEATPPLGTPWCYKSNGLARRLGLEELYIAFSGYWPEKGPRLMTRTFKEFECQASLVRYLKNNISRTPPALIVASAGNTANAYNLLSSMLSIPLYLVVPETGLDKLVLPFPTSPFIVAVKGDYSDAGAVAEGIAAHAGLARDGGAMNVARRAGLGVVMLHAVAHPGLGAQRLFDHYFQAVGSGAGAIAAWEAVELLRADGRFGDTVTRIHIGQNAPFTPMVDSWEEKERNVIGINDVDAKVRIAAVTADVLTTRHPAYAAAGGVFDMLTATNGGAWRVTNYQLFHAARAFRETEGVDIGPAAAVAVDALRQAVLCGEVKKLDRVLLHVTGGGKEIQYSRGPVYPAAATVTVRPEEIDVALECIGKPLPIAAPEKTLRRYEG